MTPEEALLELAHEAGVSPRESGDWTWGELCAAVEGYHRRQRHREQMMAVTAYHHALLTARCGSGGTLPPVYELFPFWTEEEMDALRLQRYRQIMEHHRAVGRKEKEG